MKLTEGISVEVFITMASVDLLMRTGLIIVVNTYSEGKLTHFMATIFCASHHNSTYADVF